jgi:hypothetical protein
MNDAANVQQWSYFGLESQQFVLIPTGDGFYKIVAKHSGKIVEAASTAVEANVRQYADRNLPLGQWKLNEVPPMLQGKGDGLDAKYYTGMNFETLKRTQIDTTINFNWGTKAPNAYIGVDNFSVRWTGRIQPRATGNYTFFVNSDNGRKLYVNNVLLIDKWISDYDVEYSGTINLTKGQYYDIRLDYFEEAGGANCKLEWMSSEQSREVVPKSQLYSVSNGIENTASVKAGFDIFPMPVVNKTMNVSLYGFDESMETNLVLYDLLGKVVFQTRITQNGQINLKGLPAGAYLVKVSNKDVAVNKNIVIQ